MRTAIVGAVVAVLVLCGQAGAQVQNPYIVVDENGIGSWVPYPGGPSLPLDATLIADPTGGVTEQPVLVYNQPLMGTMGDVQIFDSGVMLDVVRFTGQGQLIFYSDNTDGYDTLADTPHAPFPEMQPIVTVEEVGTELFNWADYTPLPGQPGWDPTNPSYKFISDTPEPATLTLLAIGGLALLRRRRS